MMLDGLERMCATTILFQISKCLASVFESDIDLDVDIDFDFSIEKFQKFGNILQVYPPNNVIRSSFCVYCDTNQFYYSEYIDDDNSYDISYMRKRNEDHVYQLCVFDRYGRNEQSYIRINDRRLRNLINLYLCCTEYIYGKVQYYDFINKF